MRYIDRRFLFPVAAATAWAQQPAPAAAEAEAALRARAEQFFQLQVDKKYRQAEAMVADDTKDTYYNGSKFAIKGFSIKSIELLDDNTRAKVTITGKVTLAMPGAGTITDLDVPKTTLWKLENEQWVWYIDPAAAIKTPFGPTRPKEDNGQTASAALPGKGPDISTIRSLITVDRNSVELTKDAPVQTVTVLNGLPGDVDLELEVDKIAGLSAELEKKHLETGEKTMIRFEVRDGARASVTAHLLVSPIGAQVDIRLKMD